LQQGLSGLSSTELREIWDSVDIDQSGFIDYSEFLAATMDRSLYLQEEKLWAAFMTFDKDGSGKISSQELREVLGREGIDMGSQDFWDSLVQEADKNHDGEIDFTEFIDMMDDRKVNQIMARLGSGVREEPPPV
jgi:calcium-dependent protein kinase